MSRVVLKILGCLSILSGLPSQSVWWKRQLAGAVRVAFLMLWSLAGTYLLVSWTNSLIEPSVVKSKLRAMEGSDFSSLAQEFRGDITLNLISAEDDKAFAIGVGIGAKNESVTSKKVCEKPFVDNVLCLYKISPVLKPFVLEQIEKGWLPRFIGSWSVFDSFNEIKFPSTVYSISEIAIEIARNNPDISFTRSKADKLKAKIEQEIERKGMFLPTESKLLLARQLNGPIQFIVYMLGFLAIGIMGFAAMGSLLPNFAVRLFKTVPISEFAAQSADRSVPISDQFNGEILENDNVELDKNSTDENYSEEVIDVNIINSPTPWSRAFGESMFFDQTNAQQISQYYESVSDYFRSQSLVLGTAINPPILRFRTAATRAVANTADTSILPSFLDAQRGSIIAFYDARLSAVRFLLWVIPTIGFIGTILGVSDALASTIGLQSARDLTSATSQSRVSSSMGMAFDTTLVALLVAVVIMWLYYMLLGAEEQMTVLERNRSEEEVLKVSKYIRKPGEPVDLAQQLITIGVSAEVLVSDLKLFSEKTPELARTIIALKQREEELAAFLEDRRTAGTHRYPWVLAIIVLGLFAYILESNGFLGFFA